MALAMTSTRLQEIPCFNGEDPLVLMELHLLMDHLYVSLKELTKESYLATIPYLLSLYLLRFSGKSNEPHRCGM
jgi:hypothetical protein